MKQLRKICGNCAFAGDRFKINNITHHHCEHPMYTKEMFDNGELSPWDTLREFYSSCKNHKPKKVSK